MKEKCILEVYNQKKNIEKIEVLKYFSLKQNNKDYIIYKPTNKNSSSDELIFSAELHEEEDSIFLLPIEDKKIELLVKEVADKLFKGEKYSG